MVKGIQFIFNSMDHSPGSIVQGKLMVSVDKPQKYHSIVVKLRGRANVHWTEHQGHGWEVDYKNSETYVCVRAILWKLRNAPTGNLPIGEHCFPFSFQLPQNAPASFEGKCGHVRYEVEGRIFQSGVINSIIKSSPSIKANLYVRDAILPLYNDPITMEKSKRLRFFCFNSGFVSTSVSIPRTGFSPGEIIPISMHVDNQSSRQICVVSTLQRKDIFIASVGRLREETSSVAKMTSSIIMPGVVMPYTDENLFIPAEVKTTMRNCSCIIVEYELAIKVLIPYSFNMKLKIPVVIANREPTAVLGPFSLMQPQPPYNPVASQEQQLCTTSFIQ